MTRSPRYLWSAVAIPVKIKKSINVEMSEKMYEEGYHYITNADFSGVLIEEMRERNAHLEEMDCKLFLI